jgi:hypothetical protein
MVGKQIAAKGMERSLMLSAEKMHGTTCNAPLERDSSGRLVSQTSIRHTSHRLPQRLPSCAEAEDDDGLYIGSCSSPHRLRSTKGSTTRFTTLRNSEPHLQALQSSSLRMWLIGPSTQNGAQTAQNFCNSTAPWQVRRACPAPVGHPTRSLAHRQEHK